VKQTPIVTQSIETIKKFFMGRNLDLNDDDIRSIKEYNTQFKTLQQEASAAGEDVSNFKMTQEQTNAVMANASNNVKNIVAGADGAAVSIKGLESSSKAAQIAMSALSLAGNMLLVGLVSTTITKVVTAYDNYKHRVENAQKSLDEFNESLKSQKQELSSQEDWINKNGSNYDSLSNGVNKYGKNISLTAEQFLIF